MYISEDVIVSSKTKNIHNLLVEDKEHFITKVVLGVDTDTKKITIRYKKFNDEDYLLAIFNDKNTGIFGYSVFQRLHELEILNYMMDNMKQVSDKIEETLYNKIQSKTTEYIRRLSYDEVMSIISNTKKISMD